MSRRADEGRYYQDDRGRETHRNQDSRDRSRSRDQHHSRSDDRGDGRSYGAREFTPVGRGDRGGRGGDWGGRGGGRGGRGGRGGGRGPRPISMRVKTNYFKLDFINKDPKLEWIQYRVEIVPAVKVKSQAQDGTYEKHPDGSFKVAPRERKEQAHYSAAATPTPTPTPSTSDTNQLDIEGSSELSRRILSKLSNELQEKCNTRLVTDGSGSAYSAKDFMQGTASQTQTYQIRVKTDCDDDDPDADRSKNAWFLVSLTKVASVCPSQQVKVRDEERVRQAMDIIIKSAMLTAGMKVFGRSPRVFYFPESDQNSVMQGRQLKNMLSKVRPGKDVGPRPGSDQLLFASFPSI